MDWFSNQFTLNDLASNKKGYLEQVRGFVNRFYGQLEGMRGLADLWYDLRLRRAMECKKADDDFPVLDDVYGV